MHKYVMEMRLVTHRATIGCFSNGRMLPCKAATSWRPPAQFKDIPIWRILRSQPFFVFFIRPVLKDASFIVCVLQLHAIFSDSNSPKMNWHWDCHAIQDNTSMQPSIWEVPLFNEFIPQYFLNETAEQMIQMTHKDSHFSPPAGLMM